MLGEPFTKSARACLGKMQKSADIPATLQQAVLQHSASIPEGTVRIRGWDFNNGVDLTGIMNSMLHTGCQASALGQACNEVNRMISWRLSQDLQSRPPDAHEQSQDQQSENATNQPTILPPAEDVQCKIFLGYTSNLVSAGVREHIRYLVQQKLVDVLCTTAGGIEEDFIKCMASTYAGDFHLRGQDLRAQGLNRVGNMLVPNSNYCAFEDWIMPILDAMLHEQQQGMHWTPSKMIHRLGKEINHPDSIYYWAYKHNIPVYCPALTDGSLGDMLYFHTFKNPGLVLDIIADIRAMNDEAMKAPPRKTGVIILGGGLPKHHICNANLMKNGADFAVYISTAQEYDGSDSGARPDEAVSWGKIRADAKPVKVFGDASILFPLIISQTFAKIHESSPVEAK